MCPLNLFSTYLLLFIHSARTTLTPPQKSHSISAAVTSAWNIIERWCFGKQEQQTPKTFCRSTPPQNFIRGVNYRPITWYTQTTTTTWTEWRSGWLTELSLATTTPWNCLATAALHWKFQLNGGVRYYAPIHALGVFGGIPGRQTGANFFEGEEESWNSFRMEQLNIFFFSIVILVQTREWNGTRLVGKGERNNLWQLSHHPPVGRI